MRSHSRRGLTLIEMVIVLSLMTIATALAVPQAARFYARSELRRATRVLMENVERARWLALSNRGGFPGWSTDDRVSHSGIRLLSDHEYLVFADNDNRANGLREHIVARVELPVDYEIQASNPEIRFRGNGTLVHGDRVELELRRAGLSTALRLQIAFGGRVRVRP